MRFFRSIPVVAACWLCGCAGQSPTPLRTASIASTTDQSRAVALREQNAKRQTLENAIEELQSAQAGLRSQRYYTTHLNQCRAPRSDNDPKPSLAFSDDELQQKQFLCLAAAFGESVCEGNIEHEAKQQFGSILGAAAAGGTCYSAVNLVKSGKVDQEVASLAALASGADEAGSRMIEEGGFWTILAGYATKATAKGVKLSIIATCVSDAEKKQKAPVTSWEARKSSHQINISKELTACNQALELYSHKEQAVAVAQKNLTNTTRYAGDIR
jgi:hypothetical protein